MTDRRILALWWPWVVLLGLALAFTLMLVFSRKAPVINSLDPAMAPPGTLVTVTGDYFGRTPREGSLSIAGEIPPPSLITSWTDQKIVFRVPADAASGLVTVSNSQGTSRGILYTNTDSIPTVLQAAAPPGVPLVTSSDPASPVSGQTLVLSGRGFGPGDDGARIQVSLGRGGASVVLAPADCLEWDDRRIALTWPEGAGEGSLVKVIRPSGASETWPVSGTSPLSLASPRTLKVKFEAVVVQPADRALVLWLPRIEARSATAFTIDEAVPGLQTLAGGPAFRWGPGPETERTASATLTLTTWARLWAGPPPGAASGEAPVGDPTAFASWMAPTAALKALTAKWGLDTPDPWLRLTRIQAGLGTLVWNPSSPGPEGGRTPAAALAAATSAPGLWGTEGTSLAGALAALGKVPVRPVAGLVVDGAGKVAPGRWLEVWLAGAGWVPWDPAEEGPGSLSNRHFPFEASVVPYPRQEPGAQLVGPGRPGNLGGASGEIGGTGPEPVVRWQVTAVGK